MDKPRIVEVRKKDEEQQPEAAEESAAPAGRPPEAAPQESVAPAAQPGVEEPVEEELTDLERSVLVELRKRGEISEEEEKQIVQEVRREEKEEVAEENEPAQEQAAGQKKLQEAEPAVPPQSQVEVASEESKPRVVEERDYSLVAKPQVKPLIKQERVGGVVVNEQSTLEKEAREQASRDALPLAPRPGVPLMGEREHAAEIARRIWEQRQREKSWIYKIKRMIGLGGGEGLPTGGGFT